MMGKKSVLAILVISFGITASHETDPFSSTPPLPNIIAQLINLYRMALSQKNTGRPLPPLSPCEIAALQRSIGNSELDDFNIHPPMPTHIPLPPFYTPPPFFPSMFPSPPTFSQVIEPNYLPHQAYPQIPNLQVNSPQIIPQPLPPQAFPQPQIPNPQANSPQLIPQPLPPQSFPQPQIPNAQVIQSQPSQDPTHYAPQSAPQTPRIIYIPQEAYNKAYPERAQYPQSPVLLNTPIKKPCGCAKKAAQQLNYQYATESQISIPSVPLQSPQTLQGPQVIQAPVQIPQVPQVTLAQPQPQPSQVIQAPVQIPQAMVPPTQIQSPQQATPQMIQAPQMSLAQPPQAHQQYPAVPVAQQSLSQHGQYQYQNSAPAPTK